ncbi:hypothetical protein PULV_a3969 [Pseudoalteromonas ulvae UL12]|uniref:hypothetical protein n=1 Tax=Pseudoalteromonas ulvae TaxID=107327 RepID=UPI00186B9F6D|nr:hypothetical protein [Pseudoalteromonas ulvae]MBE0362162.1 hypothetical protein [Pseudoalteromonas ulvae UL12]
MNQTYLFIPSGKTEDKLRLLFPKHTRFIVPNAGECEILSYKKDAKYNILNWTVEKKWPVDHANEFLEYELFNTPLIGFIKLHSQYQSSSFIYCDVTNLANAQNAGALNDALKVLLKYCKNKTMILLDGLLQDNHSIYEEIVRWATDCILITELESQKFRTVLVNYPLKNMPLLTSGKTAAESQRIKRKAERWSRNFSELPKPEQDRIMIDLLTQYCN